jgi:glycerophosphoryl diester phosphodiesterase
LFPKNCLKTLRKENATTVFHVRSAVRADANFAETKNYAKKRRERTMDCKHKIFPSDAFERFLCKTADLIFSLKPRPLPDKNRLINCKIISHRGEHDNIRVFENTKEAFDKVLEKKIYGIEFDLRWTKDLMPVVFHDSNTMRLFKKNIDINKTTFSALKSLVPEISPLSEIISLFGKKLHLMVEIKEDFYPEPRYQADILKNLFFHLEPVRDYHLISLSPRVFGIINFAPENAFLPVARFNTGEMSKISIKNNYGGIAGHFLLITDKMFKAHAEKGQKIGTGFISTKNCLLRELNRGAEWIFSNNAVKLQKALSSIVGNPG